MIFSDIQQDIESRVRRGRIHPRYEDYCISNIPLAVAYLFGVQSESPIVDILTRANLWPSKKLRVINFVIDGLGYKQWLRLLDRHPLLRKITDIGTLTPLTSVFPSTTAAALTTLHTGLTPQQHGLTEWLVYFEEVQKLIFTLPFSALGHIKRDSLVDDGVDPQLLFHDRTFYQALLDAKVKPFVFTSRSYIHSVYSKLVHAGSRIISFKHLSGAFTKLHQWLVDVSGPAYAYVYWNGVDHEAHTHGPESQECEAAVEKFCTHFEGQLLRGLGAEEMKDVVIMITADHGQIAVDPERTVYLNDYPEVAENLCLNNVGERIAPWGSARDVFLAIESGRLEQVYNFLASNLAGKAQVLKVDQAIDGGLFGRGNMHSRFRSRFGDLLILPDDHRTIWYEHIAGQRFGLRGLHGGLSAEEMLVPLALVKLQDLKTDI